MSTENRISPHETFDVHELLVFKSICATKSKAMTVLAKDEDLKAILQQDFTVSQGQIKELKGLLQMSVYAPLETAEAFNETSNTASH